MRNNVQRLTASTKCVAANHLIADACSYVLNAFRHPSISSESRICKIRHPNCQFLDPRWYVEYGSSKNLFGKPKSTTEQKMERRTLQEPQKQWLANSIEVFIRSKPTRFLARSRGFVLSPETVNELFLRLSMNRRFAELVFAADDANEVQRLVHYWGRFYLRNLIRDKFADRQRTNCEFDIERDPSKRRNGNPYEVKSHVEPVEATNQYVLVMLLSCLPTKTRAVIELNLAGFSFDEIAEQQGISSRTARRHYDRGFKMLKESASKN